MTVAAEILSGPIMDCIGWTLLHSVWQISVIALLLLAVLGAMPSRAANARYLASCTGLLTMVLSCGATFAGLYSSLDAPLPVARSARRAPVEPERVGELPHRVDLAEKDEAESPLTEFALNAADTGAGCRF